VDNGELYERYQAGGRNFEGMDLRGADLSTFNLCDASLRQADLRDANLADANLCQADLKGANLRGADLRHAHLQDADLRLADLGGADLRGASLEGVDLRGANLFGTLLDKNTEMAARWRKAWGLVNRKGHGQANRLEIETQVIPEGGAWAEILIDGEPLAGPGRGVDLYQLTLTLQQGGEYWIITCSCGDTGCAGITQGVDVFRDGQNVHWVIFQPGPVRALVFDGAAYREAIKQGLDRFLQGCGQHPSQGIVPMLNYGLLERTADLDRLIEGT